MGFVAESRGDKRWNYSVQIKISLLYKMLIRRRLRGVFFFSSRRRHTRWTGDWSSDVCSSDLEVHIGRMTGDGIRQEYPHDPYIQPGGWTGWHVFSRYNAGHGYLLRSADSNWTKCLATNSGRDGWHLDTTGNTEYLGCRSEWSGQSGYWYTCRNNEVASGAVAFTGCRTDRSAGNGFLATGGVAIPLALTGCTFKRDGANNRAAYAGIRVRRFAGPVTITGCQVFPGVNDDGSGRLTPHQAIRVTGGGRAVLAGCY